MQDDTIRDERIDGVNLLPHRKFGLENDTVKISVINDQAQDDDDDEEVQSLLEKASPPIHWNPSSFTNITKLNMPECGLSSLPENLATWLPNLSILFCPKNNFRELPAELGSCPNLQMVSFKSNGMTSIHPDALQPQLRWLILTDNALQAIPSTIGRCKKLQKLMLSGNQLQSLPSTIAYCHNLELVRLASNNLAEPPMALLRLPNLSWIAFSDNPFLNNCMNTVRSSNSLHILDNVVEHEVLGQGASGVTRRGTWNGKQVAIKTYCGNMTSDGNPMQEKMLALVASSLDCSCLISCLGETSNCSLVMELLEHFEALAGPPSMESCTRDTYQDSTSLNEMQVLTMLSSLLDALVKLHEVGICHGDFYGHNVLVSQDEVRLSDFGAAFAYNRNAGYGKLVERIEMRALAHLVNEIAALLPANDESTTTQLKSDLKMLADACRQDSFTFCMLQDLWQSTISN